MHIWPGLPGRDTLIPSLRKSEVDPRLISDVDVQDQPDCKADHERDCSNPKTDREHLYETGPEWEIFCNADIVREEEDHRHSTEQGEDEGDVRASENEEGHDEQHDCHHVREARIDRCFLRIRCPAIGLL